MPGSASASRQRPRAIARLNHAHVVTVFSAGEIEGHPYIVSEYLTGASLARLAVPLPWRRVLGLAIGLAQGLAAAHRQGVLHRDLKPYNVFLTSEGRGEAARLRPGRARRAQALARSPPECALPRARCAIWRPELFHGALATPQSDLYALGLILHELCTGTLPSRHRSGPPAPGEAPPPHAPGRVPGLAPDFAALIERCLHVDPLARFPSAEALCDELERLEPLHEAAALPTGNPYRGLAPFEAEHRALFFGRDADIRAVSSGCAPARGARRRRLGGRQVLAVPRGRAAAGGRRCARRGRELLHRHAVSPAAVRSRRWPRRSRRCWACPEAELGTAAHGAPAWLGPALRETLPAGTRPAPLRRSAGGARHPLRACRGGALRPPPRRARPARSRACMCCSRSRGDFLTRVVRAAGPRRRVERALYLLRPLSPDGVREAITGPARSHGVVFESGGPGPDARRGHGARRGQPAAPPVRAGGALGAPRLGGRCITRAALEGMGGVAGALSRHADGVLARLDRAGQQAARRLLGHLVTAEGTR